VHPPFLRRNALPLIHHGGVYLSTPPSLKPPQTTWRLSSFYRCSLEHSPSQGPSSDSCPPLKLTSVNSNPRGGVLKYTSPFLNHP
jgi:hypothetical protein